MNEHTIDGVLKREFKGVDNKYYWRVSSEIWKYVAEYGRQIESMAKAEWQKEADNKAREATEKVKASKKVVLTPEQRSEELAAMLDEKLISRELTASDIRELKDIFNLKAKDQDIVIQMTDFRSVNPELADVAAAVNWQIEQFNDNPTNG